MDLYISIIIPVFRDQLGLNRCLRAISEQLDGFSFEIEVIVVDNSEKPEIKIKEQTSFPTKLLWCDRKGAYAARNAGAKVAKGSILVFIDADCWPSKGWLCSGLDVLLSYKKAVVGGNVLFEKSSEPTAVELYQILMGFGQERSVRELQFAATANLFVKRDVFDMVGYFDEGLLSGGDREWSWRAISAGAEIHYAKDAVVWTAPRRTLRGAITQARRVAGGRRALGNNLDVVRSVGIERILPEGKMVGKLNKIFRRNEMSFWQRCKIFCVAVTIRLVHDGEVIRLRMGGEPERR